MSLARIFRSVGFLFLALVTLAGCGGGGGSAGPTYTVSGAISGYTASTGLILSNGAATLPVGPGGTSFSFSGIATGNAYAISVSTQPSSPAQTCTVVNGSGTMASTNVTNVQVNCVTNTYMVSGNVSGLSGNGLTLQNNGGDNLPVSTSHFTFSTPVANGSPYNVTVLAQPSGQTCIVTSGAGTVGNANITTVQVACTDNPPPPSGSFTIGGTFSGLTGNGLILRNNGGDDLALSPTSAATTFTFNTAIADSSLYSVAVFTQPAGQNCTVTNASGTVTGANVTNVQVSCTNLPTYTIGGSVSGLAGSGLVLQNNAGNNLAISADGGFTFTATHLSGSAYNVTVFDQPGSQTCMVSNASGTVASANVTDVQIACVTNTPPPPATYTIGGSVSGLLSGNNLVLQNNGADNRTVATNSAYTFNTPIASSGTYSVTVLTQPSGQTCTVANGSGTVASANVTNVQVSCVANRYTVSGNVSGPSSGTPLPGALVLQNNGGDPISLTNFGFFSFPTSVASGQPYSVTVFLQPDPNWTCVSTRASGVIGAANITDVQVSCVDNTVVATGSMGIARNHHSATRLLADGKVMVTGGWATSAAAPHASAEIFDPALGVNGTFSATGSMTTTRASHTATLLGSGKVLVAGGLDGALNLISAELFDPAGTFSATGTTMALARSNQTAALLGDGTVLIAGGRGGSGSPIQSAEIFDPTLNAGAGAFSTTGAMTGIRMFHTATRLNNGKVLIAGGKDTSFELQTAELYDPGTQTFSATGSMGAIRQFHTATLLADGKVLIVGGAQNGAFGNPISSAEVYDPATGLFQSTGSMAIARANHRATLLANGKVLISGGRSTNSTISALKTMEVYDPASGLFSNAGSMSSARTDHTATRLLSNSVLITGGFNGSTVVNTADIVPQ